MKKIIVYRKALLLFLGIYLYTFTILYAAYQDDEKEVSPTSRYASIKSSPNKPPVRVYKGVRQINTGTFIDNNYAFDGKEDEKEEAIRPSVHQPLPSHVAFNPLLHQQQANTERYTIANPLVLLTCAVKYNSNLGDLPTVKREMTTLYDLFKRKCGYKVISTFFDEKRNILHKQAADTQELDFKTLYKNKLVQWLDRQVAYLEKNGQQYDALIFVFSGHGGCDKYEREYICTSDAKNYQYPWKTVERKLAKNLRLKTHFEDKPKLFFKLTCRNQTSVDLGNLPKDKNIDHESIPRIFRFYATAEGKESGARAAFHLAKFIFRYFQQAIQKNYPLWWIENEIKKEMKQLKGRWNAPEAGGMLVTSDIFFQKKVQAAFSPYLLRITFHHYLVKISLY